MTVVGEELEVVVIVLVIINNTIVVVAAVIVKVVGVDAVVQVIEVVVVVVVGAVFCPNREALPDGLRISLSTFLGENFSDEIFIFRKICF